jgi:acetolactate decarboxylase
MRSMGPEHTHVIDERLIHGLHVTARSRSGIHPEHESHVMFQTSTIGSLMEGAFEGDVTFAELAEHGDFGVGTLNHLDGEMMAVDGHFYRADFEGNLSEIDPSRKTPFATVVFFSPVSRHTFDEPLEHDAFVTAMNTHAPPGSPACAVRIDGSFEYLKLRSVPRQDPPYPSLAEVAKIQHEFELEDAEGTMLGFRFPVYAEGLEVAGYHFHFLDSERKQGGHVLASRTGRVEVQYDHSSELHMELPPGIELPEPAAAGEASEALKRVEGES